MEQWAKELFLQTLNFARSEAEEIVLTDLARQQEIQSPEVEKCWHILHGYAFHEQPHDAKGILEDLLLLLQCGIEWDAVGTNDASFELYPEERVRVSWIRQSYFCPRQDLLCEVEVLYARFQEIAKIVGIDDATNWVKRLDDSQEAQTMLLGAIARRELSLNNYRDCLSKNTSGHTIFDQSSYITWNDCEKLIVHVVEAGHLNLKPLQKLISHLQRNADFISKNFEFRHDGSDLIIHFLDETCRCPQKIMIEGLEKLLRRYCDAALTEDSVRAEKLLWSFLKRTQRLNDLQVERCWPAIVFNVGVERSEQIKQLIDYIRFKSDVAPHPRGFKVVGNLLWCVFANHCQACRASDMSAALENMHERYEDAAKRNIWLHGLNA